MGKLINLSDYRSYYEEEFLDAILDNDTIIDEESDTTIVLTTAAGIRYYQGKDGKWKILPKDKK